MKIKWLLSQWSILVLAAWFAATPARSQTQDLAKTLFDQGTRTFRINPNAFSFAADEMPGKAAERKTIQEQVRDCFSAAGIDLATSSAPRMFFNDRTGTLMVQGTAAQLEAVEKVVQSLTQVGHVAIEVRMMETTGKDQDSGVAALLTRLQSGELELPSALPLQTASADRSVPALRTFVLTQSEFADLLRSAEQAAGVDILSMPKTVTISGRQVRMAVENSEDFITDPPLYGSRRFRLNAE